MLEQGEYRRGARDSGTLVSVIVPTRNESANVAELFRRLEAVAEVGQVVFVDDSDDDTPAAIRRYGERSRLLVRLIHRQPGDRVGGLGGAVVQGLEAATFRYACVMDGDLQHPPEVLPRLLERARVTGEDVVVGSRHVQGGDAGGLKGARRLVSRASAALVHLFFPRRLGGLADPMSGLFLVRVDGIDRRRLRPDGFKILLEILVRCPGLRFGEVGFVFDRRHAGRSNANLAEGFRFVRRLLGLRLTAVPWHIRRRRNIYDVHGIVTISSARPLPELEAFRVPFVDGPDITVDVGLRVPHAGEDGVIYRDLGPFGFGASIVRDGITRITVSRLVGISPHVLYTNVVEPVMRWTLVERGYALVHAACVERDGKAWFITARTDTGKTTTMLKILEASEESGFISDDLTIVSRDGEVLTYPKPLTISAHTLHAVPTHNLTASQRAGLPLQSRLHSRSGRRTGLWLAKIGLPAATMNAIVQRLIPPPKYHVDQLIPDVEKVEKARIGGMFIIVRGGRGVAELDPDEALSILLENCEDAYGFPPYPVIAPFLIHRDGVDLAARERVVIGEAIAGSPALLVRSRTLDWAERILDRIESVDGEQVVLDLREGVVVESQRDEGKS